MKKAFAILLFLLWGVFSAPGLNAQEGKGPCLRVGVAPAFGYTWFDDLPAVNSYGFLFNLRGGYRLSEKLGIHALVSAGIGYPKKEDLVWNNVVYDVTGIRQIALGGGISYFFGRGNSYFMPEFIFVRSGIEINSEENRTEIGPGMNLVLGHDIFIADNIGLGVDLFSQFNWLRHEFFSVSDPKNVINLFWGFELSLRFGK